MQIKKLIWIGAMAFALMGCGPRITKGSVVAKEEVPAYAGYKYTTNAGMSMNGNYDIGNYGLKLVTEPARYYIYVNGQLTDGEYVTDYMIETSYTEYVYYEVGDVYPAEGN